MVNEWRKTGRIEVGGCTTIIYEPIPTPQHVRISVESRKRPIPHSNGIGTWDLTTYFVVWDGADVVEKHTLADAKKAAEELIRKDAEKWSL